MLLYKAMTLLETAWAAFVNSKDSHDFVALWATRVFLFLVAGALRPASDSPACGPSSWFTLGALAARTVAVFSGRPKVGAGLVGAYVVLAHPIGASDDSCRSPSSLTPSFRRCLMHVMCCLLSAPVVCSCGSATHT